MQQYHLGPASFARLFLPQQLRKSRGLVLPSKLHNIVLCKLKESGRYSSKTHLNHKASRLTFSKVTISFKHHKRLT